MTVTAALLRITQVLDYFSSIAGKQAAAVDPDLERLLDGYLDARRELAREFRELAQLTLVRGSSTMASLKEQIEQRMRQRFGGQLPTKYLKVRGFGSGPTVLLQYLARHTGEYIPSSRLRVLTGDQIHTERRLRELRDLGLQISWKRVSDEDQYVLSALDVDLDQAAARMAERNIKEDKGLKASERLLLLRRLRSA